MVVAEFRIIPMSEGTSMHEAMETVVETLKEHHVNYTLGPLGTTLEAPSVREIFDAVRACHASLRPACGRIFTSITLDDRLDKRETASTLTDV